MVVTTTMISTTSIPTTTITDNDPSIILNEISLSPLAVPENSPAGTVVGRFTGTSLAGTDAAAPVQIVEQSAEGAFAISTDLALPFRTLNVADSTALDFEQRTEITVVIQAHTIHAEPLVETFAIQVTDVVD